MGKNNSKTTHREFLNLGRFLGPRPGKMTSKSGSTRFRFQGRIEDFRHLFSIEICPTRVYFDTQNPTYTAGFRSRDLSLHESDFRRHEICPTRAYFVTFEILPTWQNFEVIEICPTRIYFGNSKNHLHGDFRNST